MKMEAHVSYGAAVQVDGIARTSSGRALQSLFEEQFGGGEVRQVTLKPGDSHAVLWFKDEQVAQNVKQIGSMFDLRLDGAKLRVGDYSPGRECITVPEQSSKTGDEGTVGMTVVEPCVLKGQEDTGFLWDLKDGVFTLDFSSVQLSVEDGDIETEISDVIVKHVNNECNIKPGIWCPAIRRKDMQARLKRLGGSYRGITVVVSESSRCWHTFYVTTGFCDLKTLLLMTFTEVERLGHQAMTMPVLIPEDSFDTCEFTEALTTSLVEFRDTRSSDELKVIRVIVSQPSLLPSLHADLQKRATSQLAGGGRPNGSVIEVSLVKQTVRNQLPPVDETDSTVDSEHGMPAASGYETTPIHHQKQISENHLVHEEMYGIMDDSSGTDATEATEGISPVITPVVSWLETKNPHRVRRKELHAEDADYVHVAKAFNEAGVTNQIIKIERIANPILYRQYQLRKEKMDRVNPAGHQNQRVLYHGTSAETIDQINENGFDRSFCGKNATAYGKGVYFAVKSSLSAQDKYSPSHASGSKFVYQCLVLTGEFSQGKQKLKTPPLKSAHTTSVRYDSVVDDMTCPSIFVIFNDTQAYPEYLIEFDSSCTE